MHLNPVTMQPTQTGIDGSVATYIRRSTFDQENEHQEQAITAWLEDHGLTLGEVDVLSETASGASRSREEFQRLLSKIKAGEVDHVVVWELSRVAREGELAQRFFNACEDHNVHVHITSGSIREIKPDGTNRFVADILAAVYAEERRTLIRRTKLGQERALKHGRWVGQPPLGFTTDADGYLIPNCEFYGEDYNDGRDGFFAVARAVEEIDGGESYRSAADGLQCTRQALSSVDQDDEKRRWYLERNADDDRVQRALDELAEIGS